MKIRKTIPSDLSEVMRVESEAFGTTEESELVRDLLADPSAQPSLSLIASENKEAVGHILFTRAQLSSDPMLSISLLAPLAVAPAFQNQGIGGKLVKTGLSMLQTSGTVLVFVLGHPGYYPRYGFEPAGRHGFRAPYPIPDQHADAWMVRAFDPGILGQISGSVNCADKLRKPQYWRE